MEQHLCSLSIISIARARSLQQNNHLSMSSSNSNSSNWVWVLYLKPLARYSTPSLKMHQHAALVRSRYHILSLQHRIASHHHNRPQSSIYLPIQPTSSNLHLHLSLFNHPTSSTSYDPPPYSETAPPAQTT